MKGFAIFALALTFFMAAAVTSFAQNSPKKEGTKKNKKSKTKKTDVPPATEKKS